MIREEGDRMQRSLRMVLRMAGSVLEVWQDAHRRGGLDETGWGRGEDVGEAVSEGAQGSSGLLRPPAQVAWRPGERQRRRSSGALRRDDREDARQL